MRDLLVTAIVFGVLPFIFKRPWIGIMLWCWLGYMNPHRLAYGFAYNFPFVMVAFLATIGAGVAAPAFLSLTLLLGTEARRAVPTAVVCGGLASLAPLLVHSHALTSARLAHVRLLIALPGLWLGGAAAPWLHWLIGGGRGSDLTPRCWLESAQGQEGDDQCNCRDDRGDENQTVETERLQEAPADAGGQHKTHDHHDPDNRRRCRLARRLGPDRQQGEKIRARCANAGADQRDYRGSTFTTDEITGDSRTWVVVGNSGAKNKGANVTYDLACNQVINPA
jgi:hypothetical protein